MTTQPEQDRVTIAIVGGGFAGLATAVGLQKYPHLDVHVYESADKFSEIGAGIVMGPNAQSAMDIIDPQIKPAFEQKTVFAPHEPDENGRYQWYSLRKGEEPDLGEQVAKYSHHVRPSSIHRADLLDVLANLVDKTKCHFGARLDSVYETDDPEKKIALRFRNGSTAEADIVIGADGYRSVMRKHILGPDDPAAEAVFTGTVVYRALVNVEDIQAEIGYLPTGIDAYSGTDTQVVHYPVSGGRQYFLGVIVHNLKDVRRNHHAQQVDLDEIKAKFANWNDEGRKMAGLLPKDGTEAWAIHDMNPASTYFKGRCVMIGDAAHASSPHLGSGASSAIEDAAVIERVLGKYLEPSERAKSKDLPLSTIVPLMFQAFDTVRRFRSQKLVNLSRRSGHIMASSEPGVGPSAKNMRVALDNMPYWIWNHDQDMQVNDALEMYEAARRGLVRKTEQK